MQYKMICERRVTGLYIWKRKSFLVLFVMCIVMLVPCSEQIVCQYDSSYTEWISANSMTEEHELSVLSMDDQHIMLSDVPYIENLRSLFSGTKTATFRRVNEGEQRNSFFGTIFVILFKITIIPSVIYALLSELLRYYVVLHLLLLECIQKKDGKKAASLSF